MTIIIMLHDVPTIERVAEKMLHNRLLSLLALVGGNGTHIHKREDERSGKKCKWYEQEIHK
jgi:hypothetical protein